MPFCYSIYYHILHISPLTSSFLFFYLFLLSHIHYLLLAETQLSAWLITEVLKNKKYPGWPGITVTQPHQGNVLLSLPLFLFPPYFFFWLPWFFCVVSPLCFPLVAITMAHSFYVHSLFLPFLHLLPSFTPYTLPFHIATDHKRWPLACLFKVQFNRTIQGIKLLGQSFPVSLPGPLWSVSPVTITHTQDDTASVFGIHRVSLNRAAEARLWPMFSPECRTTLRWPSLWHMGLTNIYPALFSAT